MIVYVLFNWGLTSYWFAQQNNKHILVFFSRTLKILLPNGDLASVFVKACSEVSQGNSKIILQLWINEWLLGGFTLFTKFG